MKKWPENGNPEDFENIIVPIKKAIKFAYKIKRINSDKDIIWTGLDIGQREKTSCIGPDEQLTAENLKYSLEDQGRDALDEIL